MTSTNSKATYIKAKTTKSKQKKEAPKEWQMPPMSVTTIPPTERQLEILKKRQWCEKEDVKKIKETLKQLQDKKVTLEEFIGLIGPFTGDNGAVMVRVMADELAYFRKMTKKVFETMTQDMSDVLANEQIQMHEFYAEKVNLYEEKMRRALNDIYAYIPNFNRDEFYDDEEAYLAKMLPMPIEEDPETTAVINRQQAYHRLQWLRSEGNRLHEENRKLLERVNEVRKLQKLEQCKARNAEIAAEEKQLRLEAAQAEIEDELDELNNSVEKALVVNEKRFRLKAASERRKETDGKKSNAKKKKAKRPEWNVDTSINYEMEQTDSNLRTAISSASIRSKSAEKKQRLLQGQETPSSITDQTYNVETSDTPSHYEPPCPPERDSGRSFSPARAGSMSNSLNATPDELCRNRSRPKTPSPRSVEVVGSEISIAGSLDPNLNMTVSYSNQLRPSAYSTPKTQRPCPLPPSASKCPPRRSPSRQSSSPSRPCPQTARKPCPANRPSSAGWSPRPVSSTTLQISDSQLSIVLEDDGDLDFNDPCASTPKRRGASDFRGGRPRRICEEFEDDGENEFSQPSSITVQIPSSATLSRRTSGAPRGRPSRAPRTCRPPERQRPCPTMSNREQRRFAPRPCDQWGGPSEEKLLVHKYTRKRYPGAEGKQDCCNGDEDQGYRRQRNYVPGKSEYPECFPGYRG